MTYKKMGIAMGLSSGRCGDIYRNAVKKLNLTSKTNTNSTNNTNYPANKVNLVVPIEENIIEPEEE
jgi:hypothetical protein